MRTDHRIPGVDQHIAGGLRFDAEDGRSWVDGEPRIVIGMRDESGDFSSLTLERAKALTTWLRKAIKAMSDD